MVIEKALELSKHRKAFIMATVVEAKGSAPAKSGSKLIYTEDKELFGTVGGGLVEAKVLEEAERALQNKENKILEYNLTKTEKGIGMNCGGSVKVFLEVFLPQYRLLLCGGGHVGYEIAKLASQLKIETLLLEERSHIATEERFPSVCRRIVRDHYQEALAEIEIDEYTLIAIVTKGSSTDEVVLEGVINSPAPYIGMMGSQRKKLEILKSMELKGYDRELLEKVHCPIGLDLKAITPEEIALSVIAEMVAVKNGGTGNKLKKQF
ncbi:XdhC family protein [Alkaliphilus transvaalensis]|uniref:XdhC family protein n=1 Tax=Alkaliphilus transvaalensis TaxID=114628 RepID=UPI00068481D4|nr:XdhC family protein [Alkaliphilus transvaalensis]